MLQLNYMTKTIAILGDHIRGLEVINILRSMGAKNPFGFSGCCQEKIYYIKNGLIDGIERSEMDNDKFVVHTIDSYYHIYGKCGVDIYNLECIKNKFNDVERPKQHRLSATFALPAAVTYQKRHTASRESIDIHDGTIIVISVIMQHYSTGLFEHLQNRNNTM